MSDTLTVQQSFAAHARIRHDIRETPMVASSSLSVLTGADILLKCEHLQITGSFKLRGAMNGVRALTDAHKRAGVVAVSTGNHGRALAYAASLAGVRCVICLSELVPQNKVDAITALGAELRVIGRSQDDAQEEVDRLVANGMTMLPPFDHPLIIAGQSTLGLEILKQAPDVQTVLVPLSGGGLFSGVAMVMKAANPAIRMIGITMERGAAMAASLSAGRPVMVEESPSLADSLGGGIGLANRYTFETTRALCDEVVLLSEAEIAAGIRHAYAEERQVLEGAGAVGIAALLSGKVSDPGRCVVLLSGQNIDMNLHRRVIIGEDVDLAQEEKNHA